MSSSGGVATGQENTKGTEAPLPAATLAHAVKHPKPGPGDSYNVSTGSRSIERGAMIGATTASSN